MNNKPLIYLICVTVFCIFVGGFAFYEDLRQQNISLNKENNGLRILLAGERHKLR
jgi:hypothetical protein